MDAHVVPLDERLELDRAPADGVEAREVVLVEHLDDRTLARDRLVDRAAMLGDERADELGIVGHERLRDREAVLGDELGLNGLEKFELIAA